MRRDQFRCLVIAGVVAGAAAWGAAQTAGGPPPSGEVFPLSQVHAGLHATAWTVFQGTTPEPMDVEVLGVLRGGRGPQQDMILVRLHGAKPEYTGVVAGMSGSPVYVDGKVMGALAYRIGQFSKEPIAGITPIEQMLQVRNLPMSGGSPVPASTANLQSASLQPMETPLTMSGFSPEVVRFWQQQMAGTGLEMVSAGGAGNSEATVAPSGSTVPNSTLPGSAVSALLVRGDMEIAATCTVTYMDPQQLLACGHPLYQLGTVQLPMTATSVVATLPSPLNAFKIVNTGAIIGAFTEDRDSAIRGELGRRARMIPLQIRIASADAANRMVRVEVLDQPQLTSQAAMVVLMQSLVETLSNTAVASYHVTGAIHLAGIDPVPVDLWAVPTEQMPAPTSAAIQLGERLSRIHSNATRQSAVEAIDLQVQTLPRRAVTELLSARLVGATAVHAGDTVEVEAVLRPFQRPEQRLRMSFRLPARLAPGDLRLLVSDAAMLDRVLSQPQMQGRAASLSTLAAEAQAHHRADRLYLSLLGPETQAAVQGQTLSHLPLSMANALESQRTSQAASLNGESADPVAEAPIGELVNGFELLNLRILPGAGVN
jgi:hypothetical protein